MNCPSGHTILSCSATYSKFVGSLKFTCVSEWWHIIPHGMTNTKKNEGSFKVRCKGNLNKVQRALLSGWQCSSSTWTEPHPTSARCDSLEVARCADVCLGQPLLLPPLVLFLPLGEGGVHNVVHLRVVMVTLNIADLWVFDVDGSHGQRRALERTRDNQVTVHIIQHVECIEDSSFKTLLDCRVFHCISRSGSTSSMLI